MFQREGDFTTIQECNSTSTTTTTTTYDDDAKMGKVVGALSSSTAYSDNNWCRLSSKDPRIVRVSRAFGGKDRHSKVCTVKGLRDRRVRLSVPTAIQLYDLQDRLGLNQPSKVVDWLLDAAKHEIDELPPLQGTFFTHNLHPNPNFLQFGASPSPYYNKLQRLEFMGGVPAGGWSIDPSSHSKLSVFRGKSAAETSDHHHGSHGNYPSNGEEERQFNRDPSSSPSFLHSLSLSQTTPSRAPNKDDQPPQDVHDMNFSHVSMPSPSQAAAYDYYLPQMAAKNAVLFDPKQWNSQLSPSPLTSAPMASHTSQSARPFHFSMTANLLPSEDNSESGHR